MDPLIKKMIEAYYPGEPAEELAWNEPDMRAVLKVVLDDIREWALHLPEHDAIAMLNDIHQYCKDRGIE